MKSAHCPKCGIKVRKGKIYNTNVCPDSKCGWEQNLLLDFVNGSAKLITPLISSAILGAIGFYGHSIAKTNAAKSLEVSKNALVGSVIRSLASTDSLEQKLAISTVKTTLEEKAFIYLSIIENNNQDTSISKFAKESLNDTRQILIRNVFSKNESIRVNSTNSLIEGWQDDSQVVKSLINFGTKNQDNPLLHTKDGLYNTALILSEFPRQTLLPYKTELIKFLDNVSNKNGPKTRAFGNIVRQKIQ